MASRSPQVPSTIVCNTGRFPAIYKKFDSIGSGGFGKVYKVEDTKTHVNYAMKVIPHDKLTTDVEKMLVKNEIENHSKCNHPNIVKIVNTFSDSLNQYIVMEYCPGGSIDDKYKKQGRFNEEQIIDFVTGTIPALSYIHARGIIHRDIKLGNFLIGENNVIKLCDFGLSVKENSGESLTVSGTPNYLSPELLKDGPKAYSPACDVWALGVCVFILLNGYPPFEASTQQMSYERIKTGHFRLNAAVNISPNCRDFIQKTLTKDPDERPSSAQLLKHPLLRVKQTQPVPRSASLQIKGKEDPNSLLVMPNYSVCRFWDLSEKYGFAYLYQDGSVGCIFKDGSRMITDPHQSFCQYYASPMHQIFELASPSISNAEVCKKIKHLRKFGDMLRKSQECYTIPDTHADPCKALISVKAFTRDQKRILFQFDNGNVQVNFEDGMKLFLYYQQLKVLVTGGLRITGTLVSISEINNPEHKDEAERYKTCKDMLKHLP